MLYKIMSQIYQDKSLSSNLSCYLHYTQGFLCLLIYLEQRAIHTQSLKKLYSNLKIQGTEP